jgi:NADH dehydrogenase
VLSRQYPRIRTEETRLVVLEAMPRILPGLPEELTKHILDRLGDLGVTVRTETKVERVDADGVRTESGEYVPSRTVVWTAGVKPVPVAGRLDVPKLKNGRLTVDEHLQIEGMPGVYAIGDIAGYTDPATEKPLPPNAAVAVQQARAVGEIITARLAGRAAAPFQYQYMGELISLGRHEAVADVMGVKLTGLPAWLLWRAFYLTKLMGFKNQVGVAFDWSFAYMYQRDTVRLELPAEARESEPAAEKEQEPALAGTAR